MIQNILYILQVRRPTLLLILLVFTAKMPEDALMPESRSGQEHGRGLVPDVEKCEMRLEEPALGDCGFCA